MKQFILLALIFLFSGTIFAQNLGSIAGKITRSGEAVAGASVTLVAADGRRTVAVTGPDGTYNFSGLSDGRYIVESGTAVLNATIVDRSSETADIEIGIIRELVNISADAPQPIDEVSKTVNIIDGQQMRDRADITLTESLRTIPGLRIQQLGGFGRLASIKTRGLRNQDTALLIDGVRFRDAAAINGDASSFLGDLTLTSVNRVEVLRGSGASLYGTNSIGGTVNLVTPAARPGWHGQVQGAFGQLGFGRFRGVTSYGTADGKVGVNVGISRTAYTKGIDGRDNAANTNFQPRFDLRPGDRTHISVRFFVSDAKVRLNANPDTFGTMPLSNTTIIDADQDVNFLADIDDPDSIQKNRALNGVVSISHTFSDRLWVSGYYSGLQTKRRNDNGLLGPGWQSETTSFNDGLIHTANFNLNFTPKYHAVKAGYEFEHERYTNKNLTPSGTEDNWTKAFQSSHTLFVQDVVSLFDGRLQVAGGLRAQWFALKMPQFSLANSLFSTFSDEDPAAAYTFDGAISYFFCSSGTKIRAHVGNGYRVPSLYERFGSYYSTWPTPGFVALGDPFLQPEKTVAYDAGIDQNLFKGKARLSAVYFYTQLRDVIGFGNVTQPDPNARFSGYLNTKGGIARGGEFSIDVKATSSTDIFASYTYTNSDQRTPQVGGSGIIKTLGIPTDQFTVTATQRFKRFWVNADLLLASDYLAPIFSNSTFSTYVYNFEGNRRLDLTAGYTFPIKERYGLRLFATVENVFDQKYFENGFKTPRANARGGLNFSF